VKLSDLASLKQFVILVGRIPCLHQWRSLWEVGGRNCMRRDMNDSELVERLGLERNLGCVGTQQEQARFAEDGTSRCHFIRAFGYISQRMSVRVERIRDASDDRPLARIRACGHTGGSYLIGDTTDTQKSYWGRVWSSDLSE
jgi:hypothetical protein